MLCQRVSSRYAIGQGRIRIDYFLILFCFLFKFQKRTKTLSFPYWRYVAVALMCIGVIVLLIIAFCVLKKSRKKLGSWEFEYFTKNCFIDVKKQVTWMSENFRLFVGCKAQASGVRLRSVPRTQLPWVFLKPKASSRWKTRYMHVCMDFIQGTWTGSNLSKLERESRYWNIHQFKGQVLITSDLTLFKAASYSFWRNYQNMDL